MTLTLGQITDTLMSFPDHYMVEFAGGIAPLEFDSWRGIYAELALIPGGPEGVTVAHLLRWCAAADGGTFEGYKGGEYRMNRNTPVWADGYGECSYRAVAGLWLDVNRAVVHLVTAIDYTRGGW